MAMGGSERLLLCMDCTVQGCESVLNVHQIIRGSVGCKFRRKAPCPVLVMFLCHGWLSAVGVFE